MLEYIFYMTYSPTPIYTTLEGHRINTRLAFPKGFIAFSQDGYTFYTEEKGEHELFKKYYTLASS